MVAAARAHDTEHSIGGILVWKDEKNEDRSIFRLVRHPEWIGMNRICPS